MSHDTARIEEMVTMTPPMGDERELLLNFLAAQRSGLRNAAFGLTDEQAGCAATESTLTIGGLVKHVASTEALWIDMVVQRSGGGDQQTYADNFSLGDGETLDDVVVRLDAVAVETERVVRSLDLDHPVPVPKGVPWFPDDIDAWSLRWVLLHLIEEVARHAGHADIIRETIDGATMYPLQAAAEGWPETDWLKPWKPAKV
jgi:hypothetical protein